MFHLPLVFDLVRDNLTREVLSALPDAPVVQEPARIPRTRRARLGLSRALRWAADSVAPAECSPVP